MKKLSSKLFNRTILKYFLSYLLIFSVLLVGFFFILKNQLSKRYFEQLCAQSETQLINMAAQLNDDITHLYQLDTAITSNIDLIMSRFKNEDWYLYQTKMELNKYDIATLLIDSIVYKTKKSDTTLSTRISTHYKDGIFYFYHHLTAAPLSFYLNVENHLDAAGRQLIFLSDKDQKMLIYFPQTSSNSDYIFFYTINRVEIHQQLNTLISEETPAIAFLDPNGQVVTGINESLLTPYLNTLQVQNGIYKVDHSNSLCVQTGIANGFSIISLISNDSLNHQIDNAFATSYSMLVLLGIVGFILVLCAMKITYLPLHKLTQKIVPNSRSNIEYLEQIHFTFSEVKEQQNQLQNKINKYRLSMQKALLDSIVTSYTHNQTSHIPNIDQFFDMDSNNEIFVICMRTTDNRALPYNTIHQYFLNVLPGEDACFILEFQHDSAFFLLNYLGTEQNKDEILMEMLNNYHEEQGYLAAISNGSNSPLDIPSLYENAIFASKHWSSFPVVNYKELPSTPSILAYPYQKLDLISEALKSNDFTVARETISELFQIIDSSVFSSNTLPDFFIRCVLIDILTNITNIMNQSGIKFKAYGDLYLETLFFCRSHSYTENKKVIRQNIEYLLSICEEEFSTKIVTSAQLETLINESYCNPDFSIAMLADKFHVSMPYISSLFKKELNQNFSDYLWTLRLEKAKDLLKNTNMSIDEISIAVGYLNTSSFRRKFKQEIGITPSQYRSDNSDQ